MRKLLLILTLIMSFSGIAAKKFRKRCSLQNNMKPMCYHKRDKAVLNIAFVYYGSTMKMSDLNRIEPILKDRFYKATDGAISLNIQHKAVMPFKHKLPSDFTFNGITDKGRLHRIWYSENVGGKILAEIHDEYSKRFKEQTKEIDMLLSITGAQFNALGIATGRVSTTEYPQEIAWALPNQGRTAYPDDYRLVDELIHELGHNMFLGHTTTHCQKPGLSLQERQQCCDASPSKNDVLSYCRKRANANESFMHGFESCTLSMIKEKVVPAMLKGGKWNIAGRKRCK